MIDGGFLELVRYGIRRADDPLIVDSLKVVDHCLKIETPFGDCWRRYNHDGYGQKKNGGPYDGSGQGRAWPILTGERGTTNCARDVTMHRISRRSSSSVRWVGCCLNRSGTMTIYRRRGCIRGRSAGSAQPLVWAHAEYLKLLRSAADGRVFDRISVVAERYAVATDKRTFTNHIEIFEITRPVSTIFSGYTLRIVDPEHFRVVYTFDNWADNATRRTRVRSGIRAHLRIFLLPLIRRASSPLPWRGRAGQQGTLAGKKY